MLRDFCGFGSLGEALREIDAGAFRRIFVVASKQGWRRFPRRDFFDDKELLVFSRFSPNPDFNEIRGGISEYRRFAPELVIAVGGGSSMDVAKAIKAAAHAREGRDGEDPDAITPSGDGPPLVAIPTTAGSGSEATRFSNWYVGDKKHSLAHPSIRPEAAVVDPELTYSLPPGQTAATGFDALTQAVEAFWASDGTPESKEYAGAAIRYAVHNIHRAVAAPDAACRYNLSMAAYLSGKAINITRTTCPHALGYHLTKRYGLSHGHAVALTLPYFFIINVDPAMRILFPAGREAHMANMRELFAMFGQNSAEDCFRFWRGVMGQCGLSATFADIGLATREQMREFIASANPERMKNHPVELTPDCLMDFFACL